MSTRVHDNEDENYDEVDIILASAKLEAPRKRFRYTKSRRAFNLSDIPENFAHVPSNKQSSSIVNSHTSSSSSSRLPTNDDCQADDTSDETGQDCNRQQSNSQTFMQATVRWLKDRCKGCIRAVNETIDMAGICACTRATTAHAPFGALRQLS